MTIKDIIKNAVKNNIHTIDLSIKSDPSLRLDGLEINTDSYMQFGSAVELEIIGNDNATIYIEEALEFKAEDDLNDGLIVYSNNNSITLTAWSNAAQ